MTEKKEPCTECGGCDLARAMEWKETGLVINLVHSTVDERWFAWTEKEGELPVILTGKEYHALLGNSETISQKQIVLQLFRQLDRHIWEESCKTQ